jgi:hypothetical protein
MHDKAAPDSMARKQDGSVPMSWTVLILLLLSTPSA